MKKQATRKSRRDVLLILAMSAAVAIAYLLVVELREAPTGWEASVAANSTNTGAPMTLDPNLFVGPVREAYKFARDNPALLAQLHCYCGCDKEIGHKSLLDWY